MSFSLILLLVAVAVALFYAWVEGLFCPRSHRNRC